MKVTGVKVLILETDESTVSGLEKICRHFSANHKIVESVAQFRVEVTRFRPQMVLVRDSANADESLKLVADLRKYGPTRFVPIYGIVGRNEPRDAARFFDAGADDFIERPLDYKILRFRFYSFLFNASSQDVANSR